MVARDRYRFPHTTQICDISSDRPPRSRWCIRRLISWRSSFSLRIIRFLWVFWQRRKASVSGLAAVIHETQEVEPLRPRPALAPTVSFSKPSELDQPRLVLMEMKTELG